MLIFKYLNYQNLKRSQVEVIKDQINLRGKGVLNIRLVQKSWLRKDWNQLQSTK